jgi:imidazolonepropionase
MKILIKNIKELIQVEDNPRLKVAGKEMSGITTIKDAYLFIENDRISDFGKMSDIKNTPNFYMLNRSFREIDAKGKMVFPSFCDSHTHIVFSGTREIEYIDKYPGENKKRGGIIYEEKDCIVVGNGHGVLSICCRMREG